MKLRRYFATCLLLAAASASVQAYVRLEAGNGTPLRRGDAGNVQFLVNDQTQAGMMNRDGREIITAGSDPMAALQASVNRWSEVDSANIQFAELQTTGAMNNGDDGSHVIIFQDTDAIRSVVGGALAIAPLAWNANTGVLTDTDILFNPNVMLDGQHFAFSTTLAENTFDLGSVATHELGHSLGANHSGVVAATMFPSTVPGTDLHATLSSDDEAFAREVYPAPNVPAAFGSIEGVVMREGGGTANGVLVTAHDADTGVVVSTLSDFDNGSYRIGPIPPGNYFVSAEPVDGPLIPADIRGVNPASFDSDVKVALFGADDPETVAVATGQTAMASFMVATGAPAVAIEAIGTSAEGALGSFMNFGPGALQFEDGQTFDLVMRGPGIDDTIRADDIALLGDSLNIRPATVMIDPFVQGLLRMTVDVGVVPGRRLASIVLRSGEEGTIYSGALVILGSPVGPVFTEAGLGNAGSLATGAVSALEIVTLFGQSLAPAQVQGAEPLPTEMAGTTVQVIDSQGTARLAPLYFVSPGIGQINFVIPAGTALGPAIIRVRTNEGVGEIMVQVESVAPGLFTPNGTGQGVGFAQLWRFSNDFLQVFSIEDAFQFDAVAVQFLPRPLDLNPANANEQPVLVVVGTGIRAGAAVTATIDGQPAQVIGFAPQGQFTGLDQINILLSRDLIGRGTVILRLTVDGKAAKPVEVAFQ